MNVNGVTSNGMYASAYTTNTSEKKVSEEVKEKDKCHENWLKWARDINKKFPVVQDKYFKIDKTLNPYAFVEKLFEQLDENENIAVANGTAYIVSFQAGKMKKGQSHLDDGFIL